MDLSDIVAATDFSARAAHAVERAAMLAGQHNARLHLLHVIPAISWKMFGRALVEHPLITEKHLYDAACEQMRELAEQCRRRYGITVEWQVDVGRAHECIAAHAQKVSAGLTVLGAHAETLARELFVGSTARKYLHRGRQPTLVTQSAADAPYRRVLVAIDFSEVSRLAVEAALELVPGADVHVMHVYEVLFEGKMRYAGVEQNVIDQYRDAARAEAGNQMIAFLDELGVRDQVQTRVAHGYPARAILDEAQQLQAELIVMGKRGRSELDELFLGSATENVLYDLDRDLLLVSV